MPRNSEWSDAGFMTADSNPTLQRRSFLKLAGTLAAFAPSGAAFCGDERIAILTDPGDPIAASAPAMWAAGQLRQALLEKRAIAEIVDCPDHADNASFLIAVASPRSVWAQQFPPAARLESAESMYIAPGRLVGLPALLVSGSDPLGFMYGLLELADHVRFSSDVAAALSFAQPMETKSANEVRSVARAFCDEIEDKPWYYDKDSWRGYLDLLAASRFNRFNLAFGFGYDFPRGVTGDYFHFVYPYMVDVPGYNARVVRLTPGPDGQTPGPLSTEEREKNFDILRFVAAETARRGLHFQLGIWTHAYQWTDSPRAHHQVEGLTPENHAAYCRDALAIILKACPEIQGLTLRVHGESGIPEGSYPFWKTLFEAVSNSGRKIELDIHSKGVNQTMIDIAHATGMPLKLGAKYSAEHQSLGYHQADIRELEIPRTDRMESGLFNVSNGERRFTRYGYADFYQQGNPCKVLYRLWPGTQRHLLSGDPEMAAAFGRTSSFCGAAGLELCEPLTFKGREGSGEPGGRCAYADASLNPQHDWQKFEYYYRVWGTRLYDPNADPESWRRYLRNDFGPGASAVEKALANSSRLLPLVTSAHLPSASNHSFWPEIYTNMPIVPGERSPYSDTPEPKIFSTVSPLDPQLFSTIAEHAGDLLAGRASPKYSPAEVAQWLEDFAAASSQSLMGARSKAKSNASPEFRRMEEDVLIQNALGQFFADKLRSALFFEIYRQTGDSTAGRLSVEHYRKARDIWAAMAQRAQRLYRSNISYGRTPIRQGHWIDRLPNIDKDIASLEASLALKPQSTTDSSEHAKEAIRALTQKPRRRSVLSSHTPPESFHPGQPLPLTLSAANTKTSSATASAVLHYRHVDQAERWGSVPMEGSHQSFHSAIPAAYTNSPYPLQYYFELRSGNSDAWLHPAFNPSLSNQPYFAVYKRAQTS